MTGELARQPLDHPSERIEKRDELLLLRLGQIEKAVGEVGRAKQKRSARKGRARKFIPHDEGSLAGAACFREACHRSA